MAAKTVHVTLAWLVGTLQACSAYPSRAYTQYGQSVIVSTIHKTELTLQDETEKNSSNISS